MNDYPAWVTPAATKYCVAAGCRHKPTDESRLLEAICNEAPTPRLAVAGTDLCNWHHARFPMILGDLVTIAEQLEQAVIKKPTAGTGERVKTSTVPDVGSFWNPEASAILYDLNDWARFLARVIVREHPLPEPTVKEWPRTDVAWVDGERVVTEWNEVTVTTHTHQVTGDDEPRLILATTALHYARWFTGYPALGPDVLREAIDLRRAGLRALDIQPVKRLRVRNHVCDHIIEYAEWGALTCGAPLSAIIRPEDGGRPSEILCSAQPRTHKQLPRDQWMEYVRRGR